MFGERHLAIDIGVVEVFRVVYERFEGYIEGRMRCHPVAKLGHQLLAESNLLGSGKIDQGVIDIEQDCVNYDWSALNFAMRSSAVSWPRMTSDSKSGGETFRPETAVRTGPKA